MSSSKLLELAEWLSSCARKKGVQNIAVNISTEKTIDIDVHKQKTERIEKSESQTLTLAIYHQNRYSVHSTNLLAREELSGFLENAIAMTSFLEEDADRQLPDPQYYIPEENPRLELNDQQFAAIDLKEKIAVLEFAESKILQTDKKISQAFATYSQSEIKNVKFHSNGLTAESESSFYSYQLEAVARDRYGARPSDWSEANSVWHEDLPQIGDLAEEAARRALQKLKPQKLRSAKYPVIIENRVASRLLALLIAPLSGRLLFLKASCLDNKIGRQVAAEILNISDQPFIRRGLGSRLFDHEGLGARRRILYENGILQNYLLDCYYARKLKKEPNSGSVSNLVVTPGSKNLTELMATINNGILITEFLGGNASNISGDFSLGIAGLLIKNGQPAFPVSEMILSGNILSFFQELKEIGSDVYPFSSFMTPSLLFEQAQISGL